MPSIINASSSGSGGIVQTADASGVLQLQSNGTTALTVSGSNVSVVGGLSPAYSIPNGGPANTASIAGNWWYIGSIVLVDSRSATLRLDGTQSYSAGSAIAGSTYLHLRGSNNSTTLEGYFYSTSQGNTTITSIAWKSTAGNTFDLWVKLQDFASAVVYCDTNGAYTPASTDTGSTTQPSGSTAFSSAWTVQTAGNERIRINSAGQITTPSQAGFWAYNTTTFTSSGTIPWNATVFNRGSYFNTSTYTFTAPVTGAYWFNMIVTNASTSLNLPLISLYVNGGRNRDLFESNPMSSSNTELHSSVITYLTAGDAVTVNTGATTIEGGSNPAFYSAFQGYLIG